SKPARLQIPGAELAWTSDDALSMQALPESVIIIGAGVIGLEFASILDAFGVKVTVVEYCKEILPPFDSEVAKRLRMALKRRGIEILTDTQVMAIEPGMTVRCLAKKKEKEICADRVIMAVGRRPVIPSGLAECGAVVERGALAVDDNMELRWTDGTAPADVKIYAIGDVNGRCMLAHAATAQGEIVLGEKRDMTVVPSAVFTMPECAMVGMTEEQCVAKGLAIRIGKATFRANGKALAMGETDGMVKVIADVGSGRMLGCSVCGPHAADLVQEAAAVMTAGLPAQVIADTIHSHPTLGETVRAAVAQLM
ncbi:MAG: NAD(P)/FAD-dependent oxidoreductase, partial [Duncaniella sp.]|nr:NAD(P)/FAD-dependent oxidoreductase [Duncaniella sp.]